MICHGDLRAIEHLLHHVPRRVVGVRFRVAVRATEGGELARFIVGKAGAKGRPALRARLLRHSVIQVVPVRQGHVLVNLPHQVPDRIISVFRCQGAVGCISLFFYCIYAYQQARQPIKSHRVKYSSGNNLFASQPLRRIG